MGTMTAWHYSAVGFSSVGTGNESTGEFNVSKYSSVAGCIEDALSHGHGVVLLKGVYDLDRYVNMVGEGKQIVLAAGAEVRNAAAGSIGCFNFNSPRQVLAFAGGKIVADTWVNSQKLVNGGAGADYPILNDFYCDVTTTGGNTSTPMEVVYFENTRDPTISGFVLHPNIGVRGMNLVRVNGGILSRLRIRTDTSTYGTSQRACYEAIRTLGGRNLTLSDVQVLALGTLTTGEMNEVLVFQGDPSLTTAAGDYHGITLSNIKVSSCVSPKLMSILGVLGMDITNVRLENPRGAIAAAGEAALYIDSEDGLTTVGDPSPENRLSGVITINNLILESCATGSGNAIYIKDGKKIDFSEVHTHIPTSGPTAQILLNTDRARSIYFDGLRLDGDSTNTLYGVKYEAAAVATPIDIRFNRVRGSGLLYGTHPGKEPSTWFGAGYTVDDGTLVPTHNLASGALGSSSGRQVIDDSALGVTLGGVVTVVPTVTTLAGVASGSANFALAVVTQKINRLWCGFGNWQTLLTDPGTGAATDGTVAAVTSAATMDDAVRELIVKVNEIINLGKSAAGRLTFLNTMIYGPATSAAVKSAAAPLTYSAGTISAANADNSINDSANTFPAFAAGDIISVTGFTGTAANNGVYRVVSRTVSKIVLEGGPVTLTNDAAGETVTVTKLGSNVTVSNALAKLVDSTGGTSDPTFSGIIGATISSNATANNALATTISQLNGLMSYFALTTNHACMTLAGL